MRREIRDAIDPELRSSLRQINADNAIMLHDPLIIVPCLTLEQVEEANDTYRCRKAAAAEARRDGNFSGYVFRHEKPYRVKALTELLEIDPALAAKLFADVWMDSEIIFPNNHLWIRAWRLLPDPKATMNQDEQNEFAELPELFPIFRGYTLPRGTQRGLSWTIDQERAEWFSRRLPAEHYFVAAGSIRKKDVLAFFSGRDEREIVVFPRKVIDVVEREIAAPAHYAKNR